MKNPLDENWGEYFVALAVLGFLAWCLMTGVVVIAKEALDVLHGFCAR